jgi:hypothetical protein
MNDSRPIRRSLLVAGSLAVGLVALAYVAVQRTPEPAGEPTADLASAPERSLPEADLGSPEPELPEWGGLVIQGDVEALTVLANGVPPRAILAEISDRLGFRMVIHTSLDPGRISIRAVAERIEAVLARILEDTPYAVHYGLGREGQGVLLARLVIGEPEVAVAVGREERDRTGEDSGKRLSEERKRAKNEEREARRADKLAREGPRGPKRELSRAEWHQVRAERDYRQQVRYAETLEALDDPDPAQRSFSVFSLDATDPGELIYLGEALSMDPDPLVREEAASQLGFGEASAVLPLLRMALEDPSSDVLLTVLDSIAFLGDPSIIRDLRPLLEHPEEVVRDEARDTIDFLEPSS